MVKFSTKLSLAAAGLAGSALAYYSWRASVARREAAELRAKLTHEKLAGAKTKLIALQVGAGALAALVAWYFQHRIRIYFNELFTPRIAGKQMYR